MEVDFKLEEKIENLKPFPVYFSNFCITLMEDFFDQISMYVRDLSSVYDVTVDNHHFKIQTRSGNSNGENLCVEVFSYGKGVFRIASKIGSDLVVIVGSENGPCFVNSTINIDFDSDEVLERAREWETIPQAVHKTFRELFRLVKHMIMVMVHARTSGDPYFNQPWRPWFLPPTVLGVTKFPFDPSFYNNWKVENGKLVKA